MKYENINPTKLLNNSGGSNENSEVDQSDISSFDDFIIKVISSLGINKNIGTLITNYFNKYSDDRKKNILTNENIQKYVKDLLLVDIEIKKIFVEQNNKSLFSDPIIKQNWINVIQNLAKLQGLIILETISKKSKQLQQTKGPSKSNNNDESNNDNKIITTILTTLHDKLAVINTILENRLADELSHTNDVSNEPTSNSNINTIIESKEFKNIITSTKFKNIINLFKYILYNGESEYKKYMFNNNSDSHVVNIIIKISELNDTQITFLNTQASKFLAVENNLRKLINNYKDTKIIEFKNELLKFQKNILIIYMVNNLDDSNGNIKNKNEINNKNENKSDIKKELGNLLVSLNKVINVPIGILNKQHNEKVKKGKEIGIDEVYKNTDNESLQYNNEVARVNDENDETEVTITNNRVKPRVPTNGFISPKNSFNSSKNGSTSSKNDSTSYKIKNNKNPLDNKRTSTVRKNKEK